LVCYSYIVLFSLCILTIGVIQSIRWLNQDC